MPEDRNGWSEYQRLVLSELERLDDAVQRVEAKVDAGAARLHERVDTMRDALREMIEENRRELRELRVKTGLWGAALGAAAGALAGIGGAVMWIVNRAH